MISPGTIYRRVRSRLAADPAKHFRDEFARFAALGGQRFPVRWEDRLPCLNDATGGTPFDRHYTYHPAWAMRLLARARPVVHVDISSILSFAADLSAFIPVRFYDYRPADLHLPGLECGAADLTKLEFENDSIESLSCMHVVEHIGLGRYGDPLDPEGDLKAMGELQRVLAPGGSLYFVVPVGQPRVQFNAHRIYAYRQVIESFPALELRQFALVPDDPETGGLIENASPELADKQHYGCGCFWFTKPGGGAT